MHFQSQSFCHCRHYRALRGTQMGRRPFVIPGSRAHYAPDRPFKLQHSLLELEVDPVAGKLQGRVTHTLKRVSAFSSLQQSGLELDAIGLEIQKVELDGEVSDFSYQGSRLWIAIPSEKTDFQVSLQYQVTRPRRGMFFTGPDKDYPQKPYQAWTQGQDEDSRWWFPSFDHPGQKASVEFKVAVPQGYTAVANGKLLGKKDLAHGKVEFHYKLKQPIPCYLVSLCVAEFDFWEEQGSHQLPVQYYVAKGRREEGQRSFGRTPRMIEVFEKLTASRFPYEKYSQVAVQDFIFGGMENASATTQTDDTLHDQRAALDFSSDPLVSHELAHQWFGDLLTCRDWSHAWLNEGFATFMERVWVEHDETEFGGEDEAKYYGYSDLRAYLADDEENYRRPIVCNTFIKPTDIFDLHLYQKGGLVLNLLRHLLGDEDFWKSIQLYISRHAHQSVETLDLIRAIEESTGRNFRQFFDQWVFGAGYPEFEVSYHWDDKLLRADLTIEQKQSDGKPYKEVDGFRTHLFTFPLTLEFVLADGERVRHVVELKEARERVLLTLSSKPSFVNFDPGNNVPKKVKFELPEEMLLAQLEKDRDCMGRIHAAHALVEKTDKAGPKVVEALKKAVLQDSFWGVAAEAAKSLAKIRSNSARDALVSCLKHPHPKARRAVAEALGSFRGETSAQALRGLAQEDPSYLVEAAAIHAWANAKRDTDALVLRRGVDEMEQFLVDQLKKDSHLETIRRAALSALASLPGINMGERPRALESIVEWTRRGKPMRARFGAIVALGSIVPTANAEVRHRIMEIKEELADEDQFMIRWALTVALGASQSPQAIPILSKIRMMDADGRIQRDSFEYIQHLQQAGSTPEIFGRLQEQIAKLEDDYRKLRTEVETTRAKT